jgi:hypothetical protein
MPVIPTPRRPRPKDGEFETKLSYIVRSFLTKPRVKYVAQWQRTCLACARPPEQKVSSGNQSL